MKDSSVQESFLPLLSKDGNSFAGDKCEAPAISKSRVLVVEDSAVQRKIAETLLKRLGFEVDVACNGMQAVEAAACLTYEFILMDCQMPELGGHQATVRIRERERLTGTRVPIIALTARGNREECLAAGMDDFFHKPCNIKVLRELQKRFESQAQV